MNLRFFLLDAPDIQGRNESDRIFELSSLPISLGRGANNNISLTDPTRAVSRNHARITEKDGGVVLLDLDSKNFTYLNDDRLTPLESYMLEVGDVIQLGDFLIRVDLLDTASPQEPSQGQNYTIADTQIMYEGYEENPFDDVVIDLIDALEHLNTIYSQIGSEARDAMLAESISRTLNNIEESNDVAQLIADSISKTGLFNKEMFVPRHKG